MSLDLIYYFSHSLLEQQIEELRDSSDKLQCERLLSSLVMCIGDDVEKAQEVATHMKNVYVETQSSNIGRAMNVIANHYKQKGPIELTCAFTVAMSEIISIFITNPVSEEKYGKLISFLDTFNETDRMDVILPFTDGHKNNVYESYYSKAVRLYEEGNQRVTAFSERTDLTGIMVNGTVQDEARQKEKETLFRGILNAYLQSKLNFEESLKNIPESKLGEREIINLNIRECDGWIEELREYKTIRDFAKQGDLLWVCPDEIPT